MEEGQKQREVGQHLREARHDVGEAHHGQVVVAHVADLVRQHAGQFGRVEPAQQALGDADHGLVGPAGGEGVQRHARDDVDIRHGGQLGALAERRNDLR